MKIPSPNKEEKLFYELLSNVRNISVSAIDEAILKFTEPKLISLAHWLKDCKLHMEEL